MGRIVEQAHERIGIITRQSLWRAVFRRLLIGNGDEPGRCAEKRPTTLQEAKPKAGSSRRPNVRRQGGPQTGIEAQKSKPDASPADRFCRSCYSNRRSVTPTKINRGGSGGTNGMWARTGRDAEGANTTVCSSPATLAMWRVHPAVGSKPAKGRWNPMNAVGRRRKR